MKEKVITFQAEMGRTVLGKKYLKSDICNQQPTKNVLYTTYSPQLLLNTHVLLHVTNKHKGL